MPGHASVWITHSYVFLPRLRAPRRPAEAEPSPRTSSVSLQSYPSLPTADLVPDVAPFDWPDR